MQSRLVHVEQAFLGYQQTQIPLIEYNGQQLLPAFTADDIGIYIIIPKMAYHLDIPLTTAITIFCYGLLIIPFILGFLGFWFLYKKPIQRFVVTIETILLFKATNLASDIYNIVYIPFVSSALLIIPWFLYIMKKNVFSHQITFFFISGIVINFFHYIRAYSGIAVALYMISYLLFAKNSWKQLFILQLTLITGLLIPYAYFTHCYNEYTQYAQEHFPKNAIGAKNHIFYHNVYIGFGFLNIMNPDNICYDDSCGDRKVYSINPAIAIENTEQYENTLKWEIYRLIKEHFTFVLFTIFAKIGVLLLYLLLFANAGLFYHFYFPLPLQYSISFLMALMFNALFPILTIPVRTYSLGFIVFASLFAIVSSNHAIANIEIDVKKLRSVFPKFKLIFTRNSD